MSAIRMWETDIGRDDAVDNERMVLHTLDRDALDRWFNDALPRIFGYFLVRVGGRIDVAEDLTQEAMLAAIKASDGAPIEFPLGWLFGIARHKLHDHYRRQDRDRTRFAAVDLHFEASAANPSFLPEFDFESQHVRDNIVATLDGLPPRQRSVLVFRYLDGLDVTSIASLMGISIHATESLLVRGRTSFRTHYAQVAGDTR